MSFEASEVFTKSNLDIYFNELSKEYKKLGGRKVPVEIILIGGAAIIENYGFRDMTTDIDAILPDISIMKEAINIVGDRNNLPNGWINADFVKTASYSPNLSRYSVAYKTFSQVLSVRYVTGEYLIAMKLRAGRKYKNDLSDIIGILAEHKTNGNDIDYDKINHAVINLYGSWDDFSQDSIDFINGILDSEEYPLLYLQIREAERESKNTILAIQDKYPTVIKENNTDAILEAKLKKDSKEAILSKLRGKMK